MNIKSKFKIYNFRAPARGKQNRGKKFFIEGTARRAVFHQAHINMPAIGFYGSAYHLMNDFNIMNILYD